MSSFKKLVSKKKSNRKKSIRRPFKYIPKFVIRERVNLIEDAIDTVLKSNTKRIPKDVSNIIAEYENFDDRGKRAYWSNQIKDFDEYKKTRLTGREHNPYMIYKVVPIGKGLIHHEEWYENGQQKTDCYYYNNFGIKLFHGNCQQWDPDGDTLYNRIFDKGEETFISKIKGTGDKINFYKIDDDDDF
jgi:hypothetical protein